MVIKSYAQLPPKARSVYESVFKASKAEGKSTLVSTRIAMAASKNHFIKNSKVHVTNSTALKFTILKSGFFNREPVFEIPLITTDLDDEGQTVSKEFLQKIYHNNLIAHEGDLEHEEAAKVLQLTAQRAVLTDYKDTKGLYKLKECVLKNNKIIAKITMNKNHKLYPTLLAEHRKGNYLAGSAEFLEAKIVDGVIYDAEKVGWTLTNAPINTNTWGTILS